MVATRIAPAAIIARAGADLLDQIATRSTIDQDAAANAVGKAIEQLIARTYCRREGATFFFTSRSRGARVEHRTDRRSCTCEASQEGLACWHRAARYLIIVLLQRQAHAAAVAALQANALPPAPVHCRHCHHHMVAGTTPGGEACLECNNPTCRWTVMVSVFASTVPQQEAENSSKVATKSLDI